MLVRLGNVLIRDLLENRDFSPVGLVDDDPRKQGTDLLGVRVVGKIIDLPSLIDSLGAQVVLIAMPSASRALMSEIVKVCAEKHIPCRTVPSLLELAQGQVEVSRLRPVTVEDLLSRDPVKLDEKAIDDYISRKKIVVTGGGGSIGSELCRQVLKHNPSSLLIIDSCEFNLYAVDKELKEKFKDIKIQCVLANIRFPRF